MGWMAELLSAVPVAAKYRADAIARTHNMNFQSAEMYLQFRVTHAYVHPPAPGGKAGSHEGRRYLHSRGLVT